MVGGFSWLSALGWPTFRRQFRHAPPTPANESGLCGFDFRVRGIADIPAPAFARRWANNLVMPVPPWRRRSSAADAANRNASGVSDRNVLAVGRLPPPGTGAVAALRHPFLVDLRDDLPVAGEQRFGRAHLGTQRQLALDEPVGAVLGVIVGGILRVRTTRAVGALVHLAARTEIADLRILRRAERAGIEAVAAADAQILGVQHHAVGRREEAAHRAHRRARRVGAMHACHGDRALARLAVVDGDDAPAIDAPRHLVLVLAGGDASVALDATIGVAEEFHTCHVRCSLCRSDLTERGLGFLHAGDRVEAVGRQTVDALAQHDWIGTLRIVAALIDPLEPAGKVERAPGDALADTLGDERLHAGLRV